MNFFKLVKELNLTPFGINGIPSGFNFLLDMHTCIPNEFKGFYHCFTSVISNVFVVGIALSNGERTSVTFIKFNLEQ